MSKLIHCSLVVPFIFMISSAAQAAGGTQYVCKQIGRGAKLTAVLKQVGHDKIREGVEVPFELQIFATGQSAPLWAVDGAVQTEDVEFLFKSQDARVTFGIYLDEMDQAYLSVRGEKDLHFDCN